MNVLCLYLLADDQSNRNCFVQTDRFVHQCDYNYSYLSLNESLETMFSFGRLDPLIHWLEVLSGEGVISAPSNTSPTLVLLEYKKQERSKEVKELDSAIAQKRTEVEKIEDTLQAVQKQVVDLDKIEAVSAKKVLLSDRVTLPRSDFKNLLHAAKQYVVYRRQDEQLQKLLDAAQEKIRQLESVLNSLKEKVTDLTNRLGEQTSHHRQALMLERAQRMQVEKENARLKREKAGMAALLRKHGIAIKENRFFDLEER